MLDCSGSNIYVEDVNIEPYQEYFEITNASNPIIF
jgi:hypothetical protein